ncbi:hypothetical protein [Stieleria mannarensis]|uniref:hypothetical protein n=1 Tax=Stieleria mannarensis TaxID=2755585 RepID=UPI00160258A4|nr:hypothetical protein [Rhodopirellula sp. JC639]
MRCILSTLFVVAMGFHWTAPAQSDDGESIKPQIELQSGPLTPGLVLNESPRPVHQIRVLVDATRWRGVLLLDGNTPEFDEFGKLIGGLQKPHVRGDGDAELIETIGVTIEMVKHGPDKWSLYRLRGPKLEAAFHLAIRGEIAAGGPARVIVLGKKGDVEIVVDCSRYGLVVP